MPSLGRSAEYEQIKWDERIEHDLAALVDLALWEDTAGGVDCTSEAIVPEEAWGRAAILARTPGVVAGLRAIPNVLRKIDPSLRLSTDYVDGQEIKAPGPIGHITGLARKILLAERIVLNILGRLSGIATLTRQFVEAVAGTRARIFDTRKTTPGWRRLEKYAVRCGGGWNHRVGLFDGILIKDNHLAFLSELNPGVPHGKLAAEAIRRAKKFRDCWESQGRLPPLVEVELESPDDLEEVLRAGPDIVLLDNMQPEALRAAVALRDRINPAVELEASGGITLETVRKVAETGVDRISVGALTHSAKALDFSLEWVPNP
ncbi:MAG: carboxylating nicotinate-nucleotide diphosphorylase [Thermoguttaceae bacterium]|nr:carboxylating nicotinate-nucleotide diphosphorylase [Thermoguttaceae bacterium]MDW8077947.1 carboxylating nicotinate-nucleotide diphosphorylase [Thermoguttaceae bacterium]